MRYPHPLTTGVFLRREKRFTVHVRLEDGRKVAAHTNNTGRMTGCLAPGARVWLSPADRPERKLKWTLEIVAASPGGAVLVGVNTALANGLAAEAIADGLIPSLAAGARVHTEVRYPHGRSRADIVLDTSAGRVWVEVKNVSLVDDGHARFPDAPTARGRRHLEDLMTVVAAGDRAALVLCSQRADARTIGPADDIDPAYGDLLRRAVGTGVAVVGLGATATPTGIAPDRLLPLHLGGR